MPEPIDLVTLHDRHHALLREQLFVVLDRAVDVDVAAAAAAFDGFVVALEAGLAVEEATVMPLYRQVGPTSGAGKPEIVDGDHVILRRSIDTVREVLARLHAPSTARRAVLEELPHVFRLLGVLEHHTEREAKHVYPAYVAAAADHGRSVSDVLAAVVDEQARLVGLVGTV